MDDTDTDRPAPLSDALALLTSPGSEVRLPDHPVRVLGIDLGTTNCAVAEIALRPGARPEVRAVEVDQDTAGRGIHTDVLVPSVVAIHEGRPLVGFGAKERRARLGDFGLEQYRDIFWECKNDMGVTRTYHKAPVGYRSATEISGHVLRFLAVAADDDGDVPVGGTVVTVPASFQAAQRTATTEAARKADIALQEGGLLDEPVAAFLAYLVEHGVQGVGDPARMRRLVVFDFGGGTCDVAVLQLHPSESGDPIGVAPLAVSRYHRLGGGDIDRAIVDLVLLPQLMEQNGLNAGELSYLDKDRHIFPALLGVAEALKTALCKEIFRLRQFDAENEDAESVRNPGEYPCVLRDGTKLSLREPTLTEADFEAVLGPFLDTDLLHPVESDYRLTCSIFAPLRDALERAGGLEPRDVDYCLLVGGSSHIPHVQDALERFFASGVLLRFEDAERSDTAVAIGAAWQALSLRLFGHGVLRVVAGDSIGIQTESGPVELIARGAPLPFPVAPGDWEAYDELTVPEDGPTDLRVELRNSSGTIVLCDCFHLPGTVRKGDLLHLRYRMDANQVFDLSLAPAVEPESGFQRTLENPFTHVVNPHVKREEILHLEERMRTGRLSEAEQRLTTRRIADLHDELGMREKAMSLLDALNRPTPQWHVLHRMGMIAGKMGDYAREERCYREATLVGDRWNGSLFNLALSFRWRSRWEEALGAIDEAVRVHKEPACLVLKAVIAEKLGRSERERLALLEEAHSGFSPVPLLNDFELHWYLQAARLAGGLGVGSQWQSTAAQQALNASKADPEDAPDVGGMLPARR